MKAYQMCAGIWTKILFSWLLLTLGACATLPQQGPSTTAIIDEGNSGSFVLVDMNSSVSQALVSKRLYGFGQSFTRAGAESASDIIAVGDLLTVRIFEARDGTLFGGGEGASGATFQNIQVAKDGTISLPFAGEVAVSGLTTRQIQDKVVIALQDIVIEPQALVLRQASENNSVDISGEIVNPGAFPLSLTGSTVIEAISRNGGSRHPAFETVVYIYRGGKSGKATLSHIYENPRQNVALRKNDTVILAHEPQHVTITGSVARPSNVPLERDDVSVLDVLGTVGGLSDARADRQGVFVFRYESERFLQKIGYGQQAANARGRLGVPTVYRIDFSDVKAQFYAQSFRLLHNDNVYVANSDSVQLSKFLNILGIGIGSASRAVNLENDL
ncbi:MAG: polysaccharide biosynthesis/export family protein [Pseudomonadota bacterium]